MPSSSKPIRAKKSIITSRLSAALDKCKISDRDAVHLLTAAAESFQVNCLEFTINRSIIKRAREHFRKQSSEAIKSTFIDQNLNYLIVHWDSKLLPDILSKESIDRLPNSFECRKTFRGSYSNFRYWRKNIFGGVQFIIRLEFGG